jgi:hypothetical protein
VAIVHNSEKPLENGATIFSIQPLKTSIHSPEAPFGAFLLKRSFLFYIVRS